MIILLEGPDKAGKSSLAKMLSERLEIPIKKHSHCQSAQEAFGCAKQVLYEYKKELDRPTQIWDRFYYPSDLIYGPIVAGYEIPNALRVLYSTEIQQALSQYNTLIIHCTADPEILIERLKRDGDYYIEERHVREIVKGYRKFFETCLLPTITIDSSEISVNEMVSQAINAILRRI